MPIKIKNETLKKRKENHNFVKRINRIIFFLLLTITILFGILVGVSLARYQQNLQGQAFADIAKPILEVKKDKSLMITALNPRAYYEFEIKNYRGEKLNEIEMEYYIEIISLVDETIHFVLYQEEQEVLLINNKTENRKLTKEEKQTHYYRLEVIYDKTKGDNKKDINGKVELKIHSIQKG